jgi:hypothetical protein
MYYLRPWHPEAPLSAHVSGGRFADHRARTRRLLEDSALREATGRHGRSVVDRQGPYASMVELILSVYRTMCPRTTAV